jgi:hypothetical protein
MLLAPQISLIVVARQLPAGVSCHRDLIAVPMPLSATSLAVRRSYLITGLKDGLT